MKFRTEVWRIIKFILITFAVNLVFSLINAGATQFLLANRSDSTGMWLSAISWGFTLGTTLVATLLHRYFTFRATEPWYIAVPIMLIAACLWQWLGSLFSAIFDQMALTNIAQMYIAYVYIKGLLWMLLSYLLQRCVIYCHTTDTNGWYARFHPTNDTEGV